MQIRPYRDRDQQQVILLWREAFPNDPPHNEPTMVIQAKLKVQPELFLVAEIDGSVVGAVMAGYDGHRGWIYHLFDCR